MGNSVKRDIKAAKVAETHRKALELRKAGATYDQISDQLGYANRSVAWQAVRKAIADVVREPAEEVLVLELARLDALLLGCWTKAKSGDPQAIDRALRIMERRAAYLGIDAPKKSATEHTGRNGGPISFDLSCLSDAQLERLIAGDISVLAGGDPSGVAGASEGGEATEGAGPGVEG